MDRNCGIECTSFPLKNHNYVCLGPSHGGLFFWAQSHPLRSSSPWRLLSFHCCIQFALFSTSSPKRLSNCHLSGSTDRVEHSREARPSHVLDSGAAALAATKRCKNTWAFLASSSCAQAVCSARTKSEPSIPTEVLQLRSSLFIHCLCFPLDYFYFLLDRVRPPKTKTKALSSPLVLSSFLPILRGCMLDALPSFSSISFFSTS